MIIGGVAFLVIIALIIYLLVKNKKDKDSLTTKKVKKQLRKDDEILAKVQSQLNEIEKSNEREKLINSVTAPVTITSEMTRKPLVYEEVKEEPPVQTASRPTITRTVEQNEEEVVTPVTRVCSICGHRVSVTLKTCPYCKRSF